MNASISYVPALPTLAPAMLWPKASGSPAFPFSAPAVHYFYFARNALWTAVKMFGLEGGEVLMPAYHHGVEVEAIADAGMRPRFYRVGSHWDVDPDDVAARVGPRTRAVYLTHFAGFPGPVRALRALCDRKGLFLFEDCALSLFSADGSIPLGSTGDASVFCLYKTLPVPNGGALVVNGERGFALPRLPKPKFSSTASHLSASLLANLALNGGAFGRWARNVARAVGRGAVRASRVERVATGTQHFERKNVDLGISELALKIALAQDAKRIVEARRRNFFCLLARLRELSPPLFQQLPPGTCPLFYPLIVTDKDAVRARLSEAGIETVDFWRHTHPLCDAAEFPETATLRKSVIELPCHQDLSAEQMDQLARRVRAALGGASC